MSRVLLENCNAKPALEFVVRNFLTTPEKSRTMVEFINTDTNAGETCVTAVFTTVVKKDVAYTLMKDLEKSAENIVQGGQ